MEGRRGKGVGGRGRGRGQGAGGRSTINDITFPTNF